MGTQNAESVAFEVTVEVRLVFTVTGESWAPSRVAQEVQTLIDGEPTLGAVEVAERQVQSLSYKVVK